MQFRKILFWLHLTAGCVAGLIILLMSVTGVLLTYERQIVSWLDRAPAVSGAASEGMRLPVSALVAAIQKQRPDLPGSSTLTIHSDPKNPAEVRVGREVIYIDPYSGQTLPKAEGNSRATFQKIRAWHRWLGVEGQGRATARAITGACNVCFLFLVVSGAYLWMPRKWSWQTVRGIVMFRRMAGPGGPARVRRPAPLSGKARDFNWHNVFGFWASIPLFFIVVTALPMSYSTSGRPESGRSDLHESRAAADVDKLWSRAEDQVSGWKTITGPLAVGGDTASFTIDTGNGIRWETFADAPAGRRLRMWSRFVHTGEYYGLAGQTIAGLSSLAGVMLVWTGMSLALRRFFGWRARRGSGTHR